MPGWIKFIVTFFLIFISCLCNSCGNAAEEKPVNTDASDSAKKELPHHVHDSADKASDSSNGNSDTAEELDSATMMSTLKVLDSIAALKKK